MADAGVQYITGEDDQIDSNHPEECGIQFDLRGWQCDHSSRASGRLQPNYEQLSSSFELPSQLSLGRSYAFCSPMDTASPRP